MKLKQASAIGAVASAAGGGSHRASRRRSWDGRHHPHHPWALGHLTANPNMLKAFKDGIRKSSQIAKSPRNSTWCSHFLRQAAASGMAPVHPRPLSQDQRPTPTQTLPTTEVNRAFTNEP